MANNAANKAFAKALRHATNYNININKAAVMAQGFGINKIWIDDKLVYEEEEIIIEYMGTKKVNFTRDMALRNLKMRSELFNRLPTISNMILSFEITDAVILHTYKLGGLDMDLKKTERSLERYEKCKNLALGNKNFNERKLAYNRTLEIFYSIIEEKEKNKDEQA